MKSWQFMRHGHEMLWFSRGSFSESELPPSYNAIFKNTRARADAINWLRDQPFEQGMTIYIYIHNQCVASERPGVQNGAFDITSDAKIWLLTLFMCMLCSRDIHTCIYIYINKYVYISI